MAGAGDPTVKVGGASITSTEKTDQDISGNNSPAAPTNSHIIGRILDIVPSTGEGSAGPCDIHPCQAKVEVVSIENYGMNYHGQFQVGDIVPVTFVFTLSPTQDILPELNTHLPGLEKDRLFRAELFEKPGEFGNYKVKLYEKIQ